MYSTQKSNTDKNIYLQKAKNGCGNHIQFHGKFVFFLTGLKTSTSIKDLGPELSKESWINDNIIDNNHIYDVKDMLQDWHLFSDAWVVEVDENKRLFYYKCQIGNNTRPLVLDYIKKYIPPIDVSEIIYNELKEQTNNVTIN